MKHQPEQPSKNVIGRHTSTSEKSKIQASKGTKLLPPGKSSHYVQCLFFLSLKDFPMVQAHQLDDC